MSGSNRSERFALVTLAICGILITAVVIWDIQFRHSHRYAQYDAYRQYERNQSANEIARSCQTNPLCISDKLKARDAKNNSNDDLTAQQKMAYWTGLIGWFTFGMFLLTGVAVYFVFRTAQYAKETLQATENSLHQMRKANHIAKQAQADRKNSALR